MPSKKKLLKIIIVGSEKVGKTCLMNRYVHDKFSTLYKATIGADFLVKEIDYEGTDVALQVWDCAGAERFQSLGVAFFRGADACIVVVDATDNSSFNDIGKHASEFIKNVGKKNVPCAVVVNKMDLVSSFDPEKIVSVQSELENLEFSTVTCHQVSAKDPSCDEATDSMDEVFESLVSACLDNESECSLDEISIPSAKKSRPTGKATGNALGWKKPKVNFFGMPLW